MNFLTQIYADIETETDEQAKNVSKAALYTLVNYFDAMDTGSGIKASDVDYRFRRAEFSTILQKLMDSSVIEKNAEGSYRLNPEAKSFISPLLQNIVSVVYKNGSKTSDPNLNLLYNCRSQVFSG